MKRIALLLLSCLGIWLLWRPWSAHDETSPLAGFRDKVLKPKRLQSTLASVEDRLERALDAASQLEPKSGYLTRDCFESVSQEYLIQAQSRYLPLRQSLSTPSPVTYYFALNLYNNEAILPDMIHQLAQVLAHLGPEHCFVSIFENGSTDETPNLLRNVFSSVLDVLNTPYEIRLSKTERTPGAHRIAYLAQVRNQALAPLYRLAKPPTSRRFDQIVFLNDILFCKDDVLELIYQQSLQGSDMTCGLDYDLQWGDVPLFYDNWVARDITGLSFYKDPSAPIRSASADLYTRGIPFQSYCCWNGMNVMNPKPFYEHGVRFRKGQDTIDPNIPDTGECGASECSLLCKDFWHTGYGKVVHVPRVKVAYEERVYVTLHSRNEARTGQAFDRQFRPQGALFLPEESQKITFQPPPPEQYCMSYHDPKIRESVFFATWEDTPFHELDPLELG
ncbi:hypothetical protein BZG36_00525 [Bifiguratus adelaidae]|uniref:Alpha-1,3-mannosyltransferase CMT1 n=1 Tax=Bifiguratus adelaidae TaxID=1938954 RepID=A0A261Y7I1_9FUNG|nr:hypothetical protein BZG36_00525 [Bifiguratus adelaidae]